MKSFSSIIREEISNNEDKQKLCCCFALLYGMFAFSYKNNNDYITVSTNAENTKIILNTIQNINLKKKIEYRQNNGKISIKSGTLRYFTFAEIEQNILKCNQCKEMFIRGVFLMHGSVANPQKAYRVDITFDDETTAKGIQSLFSERDIELKITHRNNKTVLYSKNCEAIADIVALVGAKTASFEILNTKILKEIRNDANRASNCDSANIDKTIKANKKYIIAIKYLIETGKISLLPEHLKEMALKRIEFDNISFTELGKKFSPPISKSGVFHRLEKILEFYENNREN